MATALARLSGVMIRPGVSRNGRGYSKPLVEDALKRLQARIAAGSEPVTVYTSHGAADEDASEKIVGRVDSVSLGADGEILYEASLADSSLGRDILALVDTDGDTAPFLSGVSIRGAWLGDVATTELDGVPCMSGEGLDIFGLDLTSTPGVPGAGVRAVTRTGSPAAAESARNPRFIYESVEARVTAAVSEDATAAPTVQTPAEPAAPARYADNGYLGERAFPIDTPAQARTAWHTLRESGTADRYTSPQLKRVRERVVKALRGHGIEPLPNGWLMERAQPTPASVREFFDPWCEPGSPPRGSFHVRLDNGTVEVCVSSYNVDPHDLGIIGRAAMDGAANVIDGMDPDMDGDIDVEAAESAPSARPSATESAPQPADDAVPAESEGDPSAAISESSPAAPAAVDSTTDKEGEPGMAEPTTTPAAPAAPAAPVGFTMTDAQFTAWLATQTPAAAAPAPVLATAGAPAESAPAAPAAVEETAEQRDQRIAEAAVRAFAASQAPVAPPAPVAETQEQRDQRIAEAAVRAFAQTQAEQGGIVRKGHVFTAAALTESEDGSVLPAGVPDKPFHEYTAAEWRAIRNQVGAEVAGVQL